MGPGIRGGLRGRLEVTVELSCADNSGVALPSEPPSFPSASGVFSPSVTFMGISEAGADTAGSTGGTCGRGRGSVGTPPPMDENTDGSVVVTTREDWTTILLRFPTSVFIFRCLSQ